MDRTDRLIYLDRLRGHLSYLKLNELHLDNLDKLKDEIDREIIKILDASMEEFMKKESEKNE